VIVRFFGTALAAVLLAVPLAAGAQTPPPIAVHVDASRAVQGLLAIHETVPVSAGPLTLSYPKWIPGAHGPDGPIANLAGIRISAGGHALPWTRDLVELYDFHVDVPAGVTSIDVDFGYLGAHAGDSAGRFSTPNIFTIEWAEALLLPKVADYTTQMITPSLTLPAASWNYATALETVTHTGADITFAPTSQEQLVDSPLDAGTVSRVWKLPSWDGAPAELAAFADTPEQLEATPEEIAAVGKLVEQMHALYRYHHWKHYTFLLTVSDVMAGEGLEHGQSSDNGVKGSYFTDHNAFVANGDLLGHEFNHSWDGKYRRPFDLATPNLSDPMKDDGLWVYEGMTQFYGYLQSERAGFLTEEQYKAHLALTYAQLDSETGRNWRPLVDTATSSSFLYGARGPWLAERRSVDYYSEGELMWLEVSERIRNMTGGRKSLDDVARMFFGNGANTGPGVVPYHREDLIKVLNEVAPYDWAGFLHAHIDLIAPHAPDMLAPGGYKLVFAATQTPYAKAYGAARGGSVDARYSLGLGTDKSGTITDVLESSIAFTAGIGPGEKIVALDDRAFTGGQGQLDDALKAHAAANSGALRITLLGGNVYRTVSVDYHGGPRFPHLERIEGTPDTLSAIAKPL
jgi:predicted metalloprotease with PDZ domain